MVSRSHMALIEPDSPHALPEGLAHPKAAARPIRAS